MLFSGVCYPNIAQGVDLQPVRAVLATVGTAGEIDPGAADVRDGRTDQVVSTGLMPAPGLPPFATVAKYSNSCVLLSGSGYASAASNVPSEVIIDGLNRAFVSNPKDINGVGPGALTVFSNTGTLLSTSNGNKGYLANNTSTTFPSPPAASRSTPPATYGSPASPQTRTA